MPRHKLDAIDRRILHDLQADGRLSNVELSNRLGMSPPPCLRRLRALEKTGVIRGYHANVNPEAFGFKVMAFVEVGLSKHGEQDLQEFMAWADQWPQIRECYLMTGDTEFLIKVVATSWENYQEFVSRTITKAPNVAKINSHMALRATKMATGVPIDLGGDLSDADINSAD